MAALSQASVDAILEVMEREGGGRDAEGCQRLINELLSFQCFRSLLEPSLRVSCCQHLSLLSARRYQTLVGYKEDTDRFFILLRGKVYAKVPTNKLQRSLRAKDSRFGEAVTLAMGGLVDKIGDGKGSPGKLSPMKAPRKLTGRDERSDSDLTIVSILYPGHSFGEESLSDTPFSPASFECAEDSVFLTLEGQAYKALQKQYEEQRIKEHVKLLHEIPAFSKWTRKSLGFMIAQMTEKHLKKGDVLYREGDLAESVFFTSVGEFKFCKHIGVDPKLLEDLTDNVPEERRKQRRASPMRGGDVAVITKSSKQVFGYQEVMEDCDRKFTCVCISRTALVLELPKPVHLTQDFVRRTQSQDTWHILQRMSEAEKTWADMQLSKLNHAELEKCRIALRKPRPKTPGLPTVRSSVSPESLHKRVVSLAESRLRGVNSSFEVASISKSYLAAESQKAAGNPYRSYREKEDAGNKKGRRRVRPVGGWSPELHSDASSVSKPTLPEIQKSAHIHNFSFPAMNNSGRVSPD